MNLYDLCYLLCYWIGALYMIFYYLSSFTIDFGNSIEEDWYSKYPNEYSTAQSKKLAAYSRVSFNWNHHPTVGQAMQIKIRLFKNSNRGTLPHNLTKSVEIVVKVINQRENFEIQCYEEVRKCDGDAKCHKSGENEIMYSFVPKKAGIYDIYVYINGEKMYVCPISKYFLPEEDLGLETTSVHRGLIPFLCVSEQKPCKLIVALKDRFGNACNGNKIEVSKFSWQFQHEGSYNCHHINGTIGRLNSKTPKIVMTFEVNIPGIFHGRLLYKGQFLANCNFTIVCLSPEEDNQIMSGISKALTSPVEFKATLLEVEPSFHLDIDIGLWQNFSMDKKSESNCQFRQTKTDVQMIMTSSTVYIQKYSFDPLQPVPDLKFTFAINLNCQIRVLFSKPEFGVTTFEMVNTERPEDRIELEMSATNLRAFVAVFSTLLTNNAAGEERFIVKHNNFFKQIHNLQIIKNNRSIVKFTISRENVLSSTLQYTKNFGGDEWKKYFIIKLEDETVAYDKALRQWFVDLFQEIFHFTKDSDGKWAGLFAPIGETLLIHPNPKNRTLNELAEYHSYWKLVGQIIGKCIFEYCVGGYTYFQTLNARFTRAFLSQILGVQPNYKHFEKDDPEFYRSHVYTILVNDVTGMNLYFEDTEGDDSLRSPLCPKKVEIIRNGSHIKVTNENKLHYLNSLARFRFTERMKTEIRWTLLGLSEIIPLDNFFVFTENELELLLCGSSYYTIEDMLVETINYVNISTTERKILNWYSTAVNNMSPDNRGRLLQFTTGSSLLPSGGFSELDPPFRVEFISEDFGGFPTSNKNRINSICLRNHRNYENFEKSLISAINNGSKEYVLQSI